MKPKSIKFAAMTIHEANKRLLFILYGLYDNHEASVVADLVMENITGWKRIDRVVNKEVKVSTAMEQQLEKIGEELRKGKPVQYVLHEAWFAGMKFYVDENVLVPRPETEELVEWVVSEIKKERKQDQCILDIGTGSGCIAIAIKKKLPLSDVFAMDVSENALEVAAKNARKLDAAISFFHADVLNEEQWHKMPPADVIVSNPPYVPLLEKRNMNANVVEHEPHQALFVNDDDPLAYYRAIARFAKGRAQKIFVEIHEFSGEAVRELFLAEGFNEVEVRKDMQGKDRMVKATPPHSYPPSAQFWRPVRGPRA